MNPFRTGRAGFRRPGLSIVMLVAAAGVGFLAVAQLGSSQRFIVLQPPIGPNSEIGPSSGPANGGESSQSTNFLHYNPYPNTAAPGQTRECESGNEGYPAGQSIGNVPGNQGIHTSGQILQQVTKKKSKKKGKK